MNTIKDISGTFTQALQLATNNSDEIKNLRNDGEKELAYIRGRLDERNQYQSPNSNTITVLLLNINMSNLLLILSLLLEKKLLK